MQRYAGIADAKFSLVSFMFVMLPNIRKPTIINAGAVANDGIAVNMGAKSIDTRNKTAVVSAVRPVLPPDATPADDST